MRLLKFFFFLSLLSLASAGSTFSQENNTITNQPLDMNKILNKKKITIVMTDSGLGGMSVCAGVEQKLKETNSFEEVNLIFFNSLPEKDKGYNSMPSIEVKAEVFNQALISMEKKFSPDLILIACNTLSVVYPHTQFAKDTNTPVLGIVDFGVSMILTELNQNKNGEVIILGTPTTIKASAHKQKLVEKGIDEKTIINQACPNLESEIQDAPLSQAVVDLTKKYLTEAVNKLSYSSEPILAALCCTHYGFSQNIFQSEFNEITSRQVKILNPNELMINSIALDQNFRKYSNTMMNVLVVSRAIIEDNEKESIGGLIKTYAPLSASALWNYSYDTNLFEFHDAK